MQIEIRIDKNCTEPRLILVTSGMTEEVKDLLAKLSEQGPAPLVGFREGMAEILEPAQISRVMAQNGKVVAQTHQGAYTLRLRLYEAEQRLERSGFVRISHAEIVNLKQVKGFDLSFSGTICVALADGTTTYVSRRYVAKIKQMLGV